MGELKPCKCGAIPEIETIPCGIWKDRGVRYIVKCFACGNSYGFWHDKSYAIENWNRHQPPEAEK